MCSRRGGARLRSLLSLVLRPGLSVGGIKNWRSIGMRLPGGGRLSLYRSGFNADQRGGGEQKHRCYECGEQDTAAAGKGLAEGRLVKQAFHAEIETRGTGHSNSNQ